MFNVLTEHNIATHMIPKRADSLLGIYLYSNLLVTLRKSPRGQSAYGGDANDNKVSKVKQR